MPQYYAIDKDTLQGIGNSIREVTGSRKKFTPEEMMDEIKNILNAATFILVDQDGNEYPAIYVESDTVLTATENDIRKGTTAVTAEGITEGTKEIPAYHTYEGVAFVPPGGKCEIGVKTYDYTKLQALVCSYSGTLENSVATTRVSINSKVYEAGSTVAIADVSVDHARKKINLGVINEGPDPCVIRFFTYKEEY